jgi:hypothetical protein
LFFSNISKEGIILPYLVKLRNTSSRIQFDVTLTSEFKNKIIKKEKRINIQKFLQVFFEVFSKYLCWVYTIKMSLGYFHSFTFFFLMLFLTIYLCIHCDWSEMILRIKMYNNDEGYFNRWIYNNLLSTSTCLHWVYHIFLWLHSFPILI